MYICTSVNSVNRDVSLAREALPASTCSLCIVYSVSFLHTHQDSLESYVSMTDVLFADAALKS